jgi:hypothetical protein
MVIKMGDFVKISDSGQTVESGKGGVSQKNTGTVVPYTPDNILQGNVQRVQSNGQGGMSVDNSKVHVVETPTRTGLPDEFGTIQDKHGRPCGNMQELTGEHSIEIQGVRCRIDVAERMGLVGRTHTGELYLTVPDTPEEIAEAKANQPTPEPVAYQHDIETLKQLDQRVPRSMTDSYITQVFQKITSGDKADTLISDYATRAGITQESCHEWTESYINNLLESGIDMTVRESNGSYSSDQIMEYIDGCSGQYKTQLLLSLHFGNRKAMSELLNNIRSGRKV